MRLPEVAVLLALAACGGGSSHSAVIATPDPDPALNLVGLWSGTWSEVVDATPPPGLGGGLTVRFHEGGATLLADMEFTGHRCLVETFASVNGSQFVNDNQSVFELGEAVPLSNPTTAIFMWGDVRASTLSGKYKLHCVAGDGGSRGAQFNGWFTMRRILGSSASVTLLLNTQGDTLEIR